MRKETKSNISCMHESQLTKETVEHNKNHVFDKTKNTITQTQEWRKNSSVSGIVVVVVDDERLYFHEFHSD